MFPIIWYKNTIICHLSANHYTTWRVISVRAWLAGVGPPPQLHLATTQAPRQSSPSPRSWHSTGTWSWHSTCLTLSSPNIVQRIIMEPYPCSRSCKSKNDISRKSSFFNSGKLALLLSKVQLDQHLYGAVRTTASNDVIHFSITMTNYKLWGGGIDRNKKSKTYGGHSHHITYSHQLWKQLQVQLGNNCHNQ